MNADTRSILGQAVLESLELRKLFSAVTLEGGVMTITGQLDQPNDLRVELSNNGRQIRGIANNTVGQWVEATRLRLLHITGGNRADRIEIDPQIKVNARINSMDGNDTIISGAGNDFIVTGNGNNFVDAGAGHDRVIAGDGNDTIYGGPGNDTIHGGAGNDKIIGGGGNDRLFGGSGLDYVSGGRGRDIINVTNQDHYALGGTGNTLNRTPDPGFVHGFTLINAETNQPISGYNRLNGTVTIDLAKLPTRNLNLRADTSLGFGGSVRWELNGNLNHRTEGVRPYSLAGQTNGNYAAWTPAVGTHTLAATTFAWQNATGTQGGRAELTLQVIDTGSTPTGAGSNTAGEHSNPNPTDNPTNPANPTNPINPDDSGTNVLPVQAVITAQTRNIVAGHSVHLSALNSVVRAGSLIDAKIEWDFGNPDARHNKLFGFNVAHHYEQAGTYTVRLRITDVEGRSHQSSITIQVAPATRKVVYVASNGSDNNGGLTQSSPVRTISKALSLVEDNTEIRFRRGDTFNMTHTWTVRAQNVVIGAYGMGERPVLNWTGPKTRQNMIQVHSDARHVAVQDLTFTSIYRGTDQQGMPISIRAGGANLTVLRNQFLDVGFAVNANGIPDGLLIADNTAPSITGIRDYFAWVQGKRVVIVGNFVANSTREHVVRVGEAEQVLVANNEFANLDRTAVDRFDIAKATVNVQAGEWAYVYGNILRGPVNVGPLGNADGMNRMHMRFKMAVFEANRVIDSSLWIYHGAEHVQIRDNFFQTHDAVAIRVDSFNNTYQRGVRDVTIHNNVAINEGSRGGFLRVGSRVDGITLTNNLYSAPLLAPGSYHTAAVYVDNRHLNDFRRIANNTWPTGSNGSTWAGGGVMFVGREMTAENHRTPEQWNAFGRVSNDLFRDVPLDANGRPRDPTLTHGLNR